MKIIGLCGGSGSGKGAVSLAFVSYGIPVIDTDAVYHELVESPSECLSELVEAFGTEIVKEGALDRKRLAGIVFADGADASLRQKLNSIAHKHVLRRTLELVEGYKESGCGAVVIDAPLLFESGFDKLCEFTVAIIAKTEIRIDRIMRRDSISREDAIRRISAQIPDSELVKRVDAVIENNGTIDSLYAEIEKIKNEII